MSARDERELERDERKLERELDRAGERWLDARAAGHATPDAELSTAITDHRRARRKIERKLRKEAKKA